MATAPTAAQFKAEFPEFVGAPDALVNAKIADAVQRTDAAVWGDLWLQGVKYRAAQLLAKSPFGRKMKLVEKDGGTAYDDDLKALIRTVTAGFRITSGAGVVPSSGDGCW